MNQQANTPIQVANPKEIRHLMEQRAVCDWYASQSGVNRIDQKNESRDHFSSVEKRKVRKLIQKLSDFEQVIVYLRYWENLMAYQIANLIGLSEDAVLQILSASIKKLKALYTTPQLSNRLQESGLTL